MISRRQVLESTRYAQVRKAREIVFLLLPRMHWRKILKCKTHDGDPSQKDYD